MDVISTISRVPVIAILRGDFREHEEEIVAVLFQAGIRAVEVTLSSPDATLSIGRIAKKFAREMAVGAGTVLKPDQVGRAADAGARFIVSPNRDLRVIEATKRLDLVSIPGCFTPSEIVEAIDAGADAAKLFPASSIDPSFVRALLGPLPGVRIVPTGGVTAERAAALMKAGAWAIGTGSDLVGADVLAPGGMERLGARARAYVAAVCGTDARRGVR